MRAHFAITLLGGLLCLSCGDDSSNGNQNRTDADVEVDGSNRCGNGTVEGAEECDDGPGNSDSTPDACRTNCTRARCGDDVVDTNESCDDGPYNADTVPNVCRADCTNPACGDGVVDADWSEACDDGNLVDGDGCQADCTLPNCGDGIEDPGEACDDGNTVSGDGCNRFCTSDETCGNGITDTAADEECDDGNLVDADGCQADCLIPVCGDGVQDASEVCDDGNTFDGDHCSQHCHSDESCGNGIVDSAVGEACDDGNNVDTDACANNCALPGCGDGIRAGLEACDDGNNENGTPGNAACNAWCTSNETCQNGVIDPHMGEECDDGNAVGGDGCSPGCTVEVCGNSIVDASEICDDGDNISGNGCSSDCLSLEVCGNGYTDVAKGELCDDGNTVPDDGCNNCTLPGCGDGIPDTSGGEICDDGDNDNGTPGNPGCNAWCSSNETCGNGVVDAHMGEECDSGDNDDGDADGCQANCKIAFCGDGIEDPHEACDDGNNANGQSGDTGYLCNAQCTSDETCGNLVVDAHMGEACDDGNTDDEDGCHNDCTLPDCGDGILDPGEVCDDNNTANGQPGDTGNLCNATCTSDETCQNGIIDTHMGEGCDDGNDTDGDGCQADCTLPTCGDGIPDPGEVCDDGNNVNGQPGDPAPRCNATCTSNETCGNGFVDLGMDEECDDGDTDEEDGCHNDCTLPSCGDNILDPGEACDDGGTQNGTPGDAVCNEWCTSDETCGNGVLDGHMGELCDLGTGAGGNSDAPDAACRLNCTPGRCGDGIKDSAEACDVGDNTPCDGCAADCSRVDDDCGDGIPECGESCDLGSGAGGNSDAPNSTCRLDCTPQRCGDGVVDSDNGEECDTTELPTTACSDIESPNAGQNYYSGTLTCLPNCKYNISACSGFCGDAIRSGAEVCDGADLDGATCESEFNRYIGTPGCNGTCTGYTLGSCDQWCGDGIKNGPELCDADQTGGVTCQNFGYYRGTLKCDLASNCTAYEFSDAGDPCEGYCGDNTKDDEEQCDGPDFDGATCRSAGGYDGGGVGCNHYCQRTLEKCWTPGWRFDNSGTTNSLYGAWMPNEHNLWVVGSGGRVLHWDGVWQDLTSEAGAGGATLVDVWAEDYGTNVWMVGASGTVLNYDGTTWHSRPIAGVTTTISGVWGTSSDNVWVVGSNNVIRRWTGSSWETEPLPVSGIAWSAIHGTADNDIWAVGNAGTVIRWNGSIWYVEEPSSGVLLADVWAISTNLAYAVGSSNTVYRWDGSDWDLVGSTGMTESPQSVWGTSSYDVWVSGMDGELLHYDGNVWTTQPKETFYNLHAIAGASSGDIAIVGELGTVLRYDGDLMEQQTMTDVPGTDPPINDISVGSSGWGFAAAGKGTVYACFRGHCYDYGVADDTLTFNAIETFSWSRAFVAGNFGTVYERRPGTVAPFFFPVWVDRTPPSSSGIHWYDVWGTDQSHIWAVGTSGNIKYWNGAWWTTHSTSPNTNQAFNGVWGSGTNDVFAVGNDGVIYHYSGTGTVWYAMNSQTSFNLKDVWGAGRDDVWAVGQNGALHHYNGDTWRVEMNRTYDNFEGVWGNATDNMFIVGSIGDIQHWDGTSWNPIWPNAPGVLGISGNDAEIYAHTYSSIHHMTVTLPRPTGGQCRRPVDLYCNQTIYGSTHGSPNRMNAGSYCGGPSTRNSSEVIYRLEQPTNGPVSVTMTPRSTNLDLVILDGDSITGCDTGTCLGWSHAASGAETIDLPTAAAGRSYYVIVESPSSTGAYELQVTCTKLNQ